MENPSGSDESSIVVNRFKTQRDVPVVREIDGKKIVVGRATVHPNGHVDVVIQDKSTWQEIQDGAVTHVSLP